MRIDLKENLKNLKGGGFKVSPEDEILTVGHALGLILAETESVDKLRSHVLALQVYSENELDLNESDLNFIKEGVKRSSYIPIVSGQLLSILSA